MKKILKLTLVFSLLLGYMQVNAQNYCISGCNGNTFINATDPNTLEYDNMVALFHTTLAKEKDGTFKVWGQSAAANGTSNLYVPTAITSANGFSYTGNPLKATGGSTGAASGSVQMALLTDTGLYIWGATGFLVNTTIKNTTAFGSVSIGTYGILDSNNPSYSKGLPYGVNPTDVKMLFGSYRTLGIVTCTGDAWVLSFNGDKNGDNTTADNLWHQVKTDASTNLTGVVAMRGTPNALLALTKDGSLYTWGTNVYLNDGNSSVSNEKFATNIPTGGITPKMIGMTQNGTSQSYYLLATNNKLYAMGNNGQRQLGDGSTTESKNWKEVTATSGTNSLGGNIVWISPNEHDNYGQATINVLTTGNKQWGWGSNSGNMLGQNGGGPYNPIYMPGNSSNPDGLDPSDEVIAVETGGHITVNVKKCSQYFGYVGHKVNGSMGDNCNTSCPTNNTNPYLFSYNTAILIVCGTDLGPKVNDIKICPNTTIDLNIVNLEADPSQVEWHATNDANSPVIANVTAMGPGTYYAFFTVASGKCRIVGSVVTVSYFVPTDAGYSTCLCYKPGVLDTGNTYPTQQGITALGRAGVKNSNWPMVRQSAWMALESKEKGFVVNRVETTAALANITNPVEGMMVYDIEAKCLKVYTIKEGDTNPAWWCMTTPACPD